MFTDFVLNGQGHGEVGQGLAQHRYEPGLMRPFLDSRGRPCVTLNTGRQKWDEKTKLFVPEIRSVLISDLMARGIYSPVFNATALRKEEWIMLDQAVIRAARLRLRAWSDLAAANSFGGFNGMSRMTLEYEAMSDPGEARVDMDALTQARTDTPLFKLRSIPLPITHGEFGYSSRQLSTSRNMNTPLDTVMAEAVGRRVAEAVEKTVIGTQVGLSYGTQTTGITAHDGTSTVYGYTNFPHRLTSTSFTVPTGSNPEVTVQEVLNARSLLYRNKFFGPWMVYHSTDWDTFLDNDYARLGGTNSTMTLRDRLRKIDGIQDVRRLDFLDEATNPFTMLFVQMTSDVARAINGMDLTTVQWESKAGLALHFKVMCIYVPQLRADYYGNCGILHATTGS